LFTDTGSAITGIAVPAAITAAPLRATVT
jgi:hypothetical protein